MLGRAGVHSVRSKRTWYILDLSDDDQQVESATADEGKSVEDSNSVQAETFIICTTAGLYINDVDWPCATSHSLSWAGWSIGKALPYMLG
ncbi:hypothetical protein AVEN_247203-1 [Araneus ventricosus]|uniref:Uncharacterized protein n=1 Tax=Araneus ventricosus TaxID=182803 RepID=A0A4Y2VUC1_ARAVE|nr:hypothetical protein AVEN_247203-1 [Araneus ventricosus]